MSQIIRITSEALQATVRRLLPSQQGFGEDLQASNVITPIIDLTPTAEGSQLPVDLARAMSRTDQTNFEVNNSLSDIANTPGFYRGIVVLAIAFSGSSNPRTLIEMRGAVNKAVWEHKIQGSTSTHSSTTNFDYVFFLDTGDTLRMSSNSTAATLAGSVRQVADRYGNVSNPTGFTFE